MTRQKVGPGPITSANSFTVTRRMDRAGDWAFTMPAGDPMAAYVISQRVASIQAIIGGVWTYAGGGGIDRIEKSVGDSGDVSLNASGADQLRELTYRRVNEAFDTVDVLDILTQLNTYCPLWTFTADPNWTGTGPDLYISFSGESVLAALLRIVETLGSHFYLSGERTLTFRTGPTVSGVRAVRAGGDLAPELCAITQLDEITDSYAMRTRIIPYGAGTGAARLTLEGCTATPPAGYTLDTANNFLKKDSAELAYGRREEIVEFKQIRAISNTDPDVEAASNALYESAKHWLDDNLSPQVTYKLALEGCSEILHPMQTIRVVYYSQTLDIDDDLIILEATLQENASGIETTGLVVSSRARWPDTDSSSVIETITQGAAFIAHPQAGANSYTTRYTGLVDDTYSASFRFRFGDEVTRLSQVLFEFRVLPLESTVKTIGVESDTGGAGELETSGNTDQSDTPSNNTSNVPSVNTSGTPSNNTSGGSGTLTTDEASGGDTESGGVHHHELNIVRATIGGGYTVVYIDPVSEQLYTTGAGDSLNPGTTNKGDHVHEITSGHTHNLNSHTHDLNNHTHNLNNHTHNLNNHKHTLTPVLSAVYGIFRETEINTFDVDDMEYRVNGGTWQELGEATAIDDDWYQLDLTAQVSSAIFRPLQISNTVDIRKAPSSITSATSANIEVLLSVRNHIQAIAYI